MNPFKKTNGERRLIDWFIAALGIILAVLLFFLIQQYRTLRRESILSARESWLMNALKNHPHLTAADAGAIHAWMTFDYLNKLFNLPPEYLKSQLSIPNAGYPKLTIDEFAESIHQGASSTLVNVQNAVRQYLSAPANTSST